MAEVDGEVVGFAQFVWDADATEAFVGEGGAMLQSLYVLPERWGEGVGTRLLEAGIDRLPPDRERLHLGVHEANDRAIGFYESRGFERAGAYDYEVGDALAQTYPSLVYSLEL